MELNIHHIVWSIIGLTSEAGKYEKYTLSTEKSQPLQNLYLWQILKGKWLRSADYLFTETLFYASNMVLVTVRSELCINCSYEA